jgi:hypothetical protein
MITVEKREDLASNSDVYTVRVPRADLDAIKLDPIDKMVLGEPMENAADVLQNLQILAFRQSQQTEVEAPHVQQ